MSFFFQVEIFFFLWINSNNNKKKIDKESLMNQMYMKFYYIYYVMNSLNANQIAGKTRSYDSSEIALSFAYY